MPPIKNWSRRRDLERKETKVWQHEDGDIIWVSHKVPDDGYYINVCRGDEWDRRMSDSVDLGYSHVKSVAKQIGSQECRKNTNGFFEQ